MLERLRHIVSYIDGEYLSCGFTEDFIAAALSNGWSDATLEDPRDGDYFNPNWKTVRYEFWNGKTTVVSEVIEEIARMLDTKEYITITVDMNPSDTFFDHAYVLCKIDNRILCADSYTGQRPVGIRDLSLNDLRNFLESPTVTTWNSLCDVNEKVVAHDVASEVVLEVFFLD